MSSAAQARRQRFGVWAHGRGELALGAPLVMGVVNLTPDSFFDGGRWMPEAGAPPSRSVVARACVKMVEAGAAILDVGGESTRPGSAPVAIEDEIERVAPVLRHLREMDATAKVPLSVDTRHASVAAAAVEAGADIVNDISGLADADMARVVADSGAGLVVGHLRGEPSTMQDEIRFERMLVEVGDELARSVERALEAGVESARIVVDPCVGFGKTAEQSAALIASSDLLAARTGCPVMIGASRKSVLGHLTGRPVEERLLSSVVAALVASRHGAAVVRVHDVDATVEALRVSAGIERAFAAERERAEGRVS